MAQVDALVARPENEKQKAIDEIKKFADKKDLNVNYKRTTKSVYNPSIAEEVYTTDYDQYRSGRAKQQDYPIRTSSARCWRKGKTFNTEDKYSKSELETMARQFIAKNVPEVKLDDLSANFGDKEKECELFLPLGKIQHGKSRIFILLSGRFPGRRLAKAT